ncbi:UNVERIFIED_CONTAM: hypothetical protein GTU68_030274 [Idotea baltica]|nr:hypothetical protein [Idotea baltica]
MSNPFAIGSGSISIEDVQALLKDKRHLSLNDHARQKVIDCRNYLEDKLSQNDESYYGINTGFGDLCNVVIPKKDIGQLQYNLLVSHACGVGPQIDPEVVRIMLILKVNSLALAYSGVRIVLIEKLIELYNRNLIPVVYQFGSLGASGDLAPLAHMSLPLIGKGELYIEGKKTDVESNIASIGFENISLESKEGLALINGTQFMAAFACQNMIRAKRIIKWANLIAAVAVDGYMAKTKPFTAEIHNIRLHPGQQASAAIIREYLSDSPIAQLKKQQVQDPYSFRCIPQVHGASMDALAHCEEVCTREMNAVTDNPGIFYEQDLMVSGGNFHGQAIAMALDYMAIAVAELGNISERRTYLMLNGKRGLAPFLIQDPGLHSGLMIPQYTAASLVSYNKQLCTPASVDSIPSSNGQEDHVSMGANAAVQCSQVIDNVEQVMAIELLTACQALSFRRPLKSSELIEKLYADFREIVSFNQADRVLYKDIRNTVEFMKNYDWTNNTIL